MFLNIKSLPIIQVPLLQQYDWLVHGFGTKDIPIEKYLDAFGVSNPQIPQTHQIHSKALHLLTTKEKVSSPWSTVSGPQLEGDAFVTDEPGVVCWVRSADCLPILLVDPVHKVVGAIHSGWRGTAQKVVVETIKKMQKEWKTDLACLKVALGPCIDGRSYRVKNDVVVAFREAQLSPGPWLEEIDHDHWYLDIAHANLHLLKTMGIPRESIYLSLACTASDPDHFHSFRAEKGKKGNQVSFVMIK